MKNKWMVKFGAVLLTGALMTGCGTVKEDNDIDRRDEVPPMENNEKDQDINNDDNRNDLDQNNDRLDEENNDQNINEQQDGEKNNQRDGEMNDQEMNKDEN